jgi:hypothetical protein
MPEKREEGTMKLFFEDGTPCHSFLDLAHCISHGEFFKDHHGMHFEECFAAGGDGSLYKTKSTDEGPAAYLTESGSKALAALCKATTAFGAFRKGDKGVLKEMGVATPDGESGGLVEKIPSYRVLRAVTKGNLTADTDLDRESNFQPVALADEHAILAGPGSGPVVVETDASTAILSLFLHMGMTDKKRQPEELNGVNLPRHLCQLKVNTRCMPAMTRLYDAKKVASDEGKARVASLGGATATSKMSDEAGLVLTAMGRGEAGNTFALQPFYATVYSVTKGDASLPQSAEVISIESVMDVPTTLEDNPRAAIITAKEVRNLWDLLFLGMEEVKITLPEDESDTEAQATKAFALLVATMYQVFGGLKTCADWSKLYMRLCQSDKLSRYNLDRVLESLTWPERNHMVYYMFAAVTNLRISILDGLGRVSGSKLACISRYPQVSHNGLVYPNRSFVQGGPPDFSVVGETVALRSIAFNQGPYVGPARLQMCSEFSKGVLKRVNQVTNTGLFDFVHDYVVLAAAPENREKYWCGTTDTELKQLQEQRRKEAFGILLDDTNDNRHLKLVHQSSQLGELKRNCINNFHGRRNVNSGLCMASSNQGHALLTWLVYIMASSFYFPTKEGQGKKDVSYSEMLIFTRNGGIRGLCSPLELQKKDLLYANDAYNFQVCHVPCLSSNGLLPIILMPTRPKHCPLFHPPQGFFPCGKEPNLNAAATAFAEIIDTNKYLLGCYYMEFFMAGIRSRGSTNTTIMKWMTQMSAQTCILEVVNLYGVVIPLPRAMRSHLPHFVKLMDPLTLWDGSTSVCLSQDGNPVYPNVTKLVQIVMLTCMHPWNDQAGTEQVVTSPVDKQFPFKFARDVPLVKKVFGEAKVGGQYWKSMESGAGDEGLFNPMFQMLGKEVKPVRLVELLQAIMKRGNEKKGSNICNSWKRWDQWLSHLPEVGFDSFWRNPVKVVNIMKKKHNGEKEMEEYHKLATSLRYLYDKDGKLVYYKPAHDHAIDSVGHKSAKKDLVVAVSSRKESKNGGKPATAHTEHSKKRDETAAEGNSTGAQSHGASPTAKATNATSLPSVEENVVTVGAYPVYKYQKSSEETFFKVLDSIPDVDWKVPSPDDFSTARLTAGYDHLHEALFEITLSHASYAGTSLPSKDDLRQHFQKIPMPGGCMEEVLKEMHQVAEKWRKALLTPLIPMLKPNEVEKVAENEKGSTSVRSSKDDQDNEMEKVVVEKAPKKVEALQAAEETGEPPAQGRRSVDKEMEKVVVEKAPKKVEALQAAEETGEPPAQGRKSVDNEMEKVVVEKAPKKVEALQAAEETGEPPAQWRKSVDNEMEKVVVEKAPKKVEALQAAEETGEPPAQGHKSVGSSIDGQEDRDSMEFEGERRPRRITGFSGGEPQGSDEEEEVRENKKWEERKKKKKKEEEEERKKKKDKERKKKRKSDGSSSSNSQDNKDSEKPAAKKKKKRPVATAPPATRTSYADTTDSESSTTSVSKEQVKEQNSQPGSSRKLGSGSQPGSVKKKISSQHLKPKISTTPNYGFGGKNGRENMGPNSTYPSAT